MPEDDMDRRVSSVTGVFSERDAAALVGRSIVIGLFHLAADGTTARREQLYGVIASVDPARTVKITLDPSGETLSLPADPLAYQPAPPGDYQFYDTGRTVADPDFLTRWRVRPSQDGPPTFERRDRSRPMPPQE
jgi:hypothetical protein